MISIFIGHDYKSGYVKQLFTTHAKKQDYMISKTLLGAFSMVCMCVTYLTGGVVSGLFTGLPFTIGAGSLICAVLGKMIMSLGWASLYTFINIIFRSKFAYPLRCASFSARGFPSSARRLYSAIRLRSISSFTVRPFTPALRAMRSRYSSVS